MQVITKQIYAKPPKEFAWSYSKLKNYETCPKRHYQIDLAKLVKEQRSEDLEWGDRVHAAAAARLSRRTALAPEMKTLEPWCQRIEMGAVGGNILTECKFAITRDMAPCSWFDRQVWLRGIADVLVLKPPVALAIDWKTGKILEDLVQLALVGALVFAHHPDIQKIRSVFVWLKEGTESTVDMTRDDLPGLWNGVLPRVESLELADLTGNYPAKPGGLCKRYCPVESCEYHGVGSH